MVMASTPRPAQLMLQSALRVDIFTLLTCQPITDQYSGDNQSQISIMVGNNQHPITAQITTNHGPVLLTSTRLPSVSTLNCPTTRLSVTTISVSPRSW